MRKIFAVVAILLTASLVLQIYLAAVGVFSRPEDELFALHGTNGRIVLPILALLTILAAAFARTGRRTVWLSVLPLALILFQTVLFILTGALFSVTEESTEIPLGATLVLSLHGLIGLTALWIASILARRSWRLAFPRTTTEGTIEGLEPMTAPVVAPAPQAAVTPEGAPRGKSEVEE